VTLVYAFVKGLVCGARRTDIPEKASVVDQTVEAARIARGFNRWAGFGIQKLIQDGLCRVVHFLFAFTVLKNKLKAAAMPHPSECAGGG
jgi:hypothetical protein